MRMACSAGLPEGYRLLKFPTLDSTNAEALRRAGEGEAGGLWILAAAQTAGRGRQGRSWQSLAGNLFASLLLRPSCDLDTARQLAFVAGLAVFDAAAELCGPEKAARLRLKWPNDLLLGNAKVAGILLESADAGGSRAVVIGTGLNLVNAPGNIGQTTTHLTSNAVDPMDPLETLAQSTAHWLGIWQEGAGWEAVRSAWAKRGPIIGQSIEVRENSAKSQGTYAGIDIDGSLLLGLDGGKSRRVLAGDVFLL